MLLPTYKLAYNTPIPAVFLAANLDFNNEETLRCANKAASTCT